MYLKRKKTCRRHKARFCFLYIWHLHMADGIILYFSHFLIFLYEISKIILQAYPAYLISSVNCITWIINIRHILLLFTFRKKSLCSHQISDSLILCNILSTFEVILNWSILKLHKAHLFMCVRLKIWPISKLFLSYLTNLVKTNNN